MLALRLSTAAVGIPLLLVVLWAGQPWLAVLVAVVVLLAAVEVGELLALAGHAPAQGVVVLFAVGAVVLGAASAGIDLAWLGWLVALVATSLAVGLRRADGARAVRAWIGTVAGATYAAMLAFLLVIALSVRSDGATGPLVELLDPGRAWLVIVVLGVWSYDTAAYAIGRAWGRGRFFNHISPNKTWSGAIGGGVASTLAGLALGAVVGRPIEGAGLGAMIAFAAPVGDLAESALKRAAGVKDSGRLFPGHGGMLDRVDSFVTVAPLAWLYLAVVGIA